MIDYPDDQATQEQAEKHGISEPVLIRDLVRIVEVVNLEQKGFFSERSVLAGSMALRCFGSPRFTVFDADFSAEENSGLNRAGLQKMLRYEDADLTIEPSELTPSHDGSKVWKSEPIRYEPLFTALTPNVDDRRSRSTSPTAGSSAQARRPS